MGNAATQRLGELARRPLRRAVGRFALGRPSQNTRFQRFGQLVSTTSLVPSKQPCQTLAFKAPTPQANETAAAVQLAANLRPGYSLQPEAESSAPDARYRSVHPALTCRRSSANSLFVSFISPSMGVVILSNQLLQALGAEMRVKLNDINPEGYRSSHLKRRVTLSRRSAIGVDHSAPPVNAD
jgi:hypothetical protein